MLNEATDNAKELALAKINGSGRMGACYTYGLIIGCDFAELAKFMSTRLVSLVSDMTRGSIIENQSSINNVINAIRYYNIGASPEDYMPKEYASSAFHILMDVFKDFPQISRINDLALTEGGRDIIRERMKVISKNKKNVFKSERNQ
jgi:hypothetical protein